MSRSRLRIGLTGGIGSGKSTVARLLQSRGAHVIDADAISRASTGPGGGAMAAISAHFGSDCMASDGSLDRDRMRKIVFAEPAARQSLEAIIHPIVTTEMRRQAQAVDSPCTIFDLPLLVESPRWRPQLDLVLVVDCSRETQVRRVHERNGWDSATIDAVIQAQCTRQQRLAAADLVIFNDGNSIDALDHLMAQVAPHFGL